MKSKEFWKAVIQIAISILTAALTAMGTTSCMGLIGCPLPATRGSQRHKNGKRWENALTHSLTSWFVFSL